MTNVCNSSSSRPLTLVFLSTFGCCLWVLVRVILQGQSQVNLSELRIIAGQEWLEQRTSLLVDAEAPCGDAAPYIPNHPTRLLLSRNLRDWYRISLAQ